MQNNKLKISKVIKPGFITLIFCCVFALSVQSAFGYTLSDSELNKIILNRLNKETKEYINDADYEIKIHGTLSDVETNENEMPKVEISEISSFNPVSYRRVIVKNSKGNIIRTFPLNIQVLIYKDVLVASENIGFNKEINSANTKLERKEISKLYDKVITDKEVNLISSKNIIKGNIIQKNYTKQKAIVEKNQDVDIVFQGKGVQVALRGKALAQGSLGDIILVRSEKYHKTYSARVDSASKVTVRI